MGAGAAGSTSSAQLETFSSALGTCSISDAFMKEGEVVSSAPSTRAVTESVGPAGADETATFSCLGAEDPRVGVAGVDSAVEVRPSMSSLTRASVRG